MVPGARNREGGLRHGDRPVREQQADLRAIRAPKRGYLGYPWEYFVQRIRAENLEMVAGAQEQLLGARIPSSPGR